MAKPLHIRTRFFGGNFSESVAPEYILHFPHRDPSSGDHVQRLHVERSPPQFLGNFSGVAPVLRVGWVDLRVDRKSQSPSATVKLLDLGMD
jgi:hypothetical protein